MAKSPRKPVHQASKRASIRRDEVLEIKEFKERLGIKDTRTAVKLLRSLGLPVDLIAGVVLINGEAFFQATKPKQNEGADS